MRVTNWSLTNAGNFGAYMVPLLNIFLGQTYQYLENSNLTTILTQNLLIMFIEKSGQGK
jgi:hypothetical protein